MSRPFELVSEFQPTGDQPKAIAALLEGLSRGERAQVLLGITGSGKTYTIANVIAQSNRPALVLAPNKTLAAQLYGEFKGLFPNNAVEFFVSYYDYYQPEAYIPSSDTFIDKDAIINDTIDRLRHSATRSLLLRKDVIIVASVSCIYGIGSSESYHGMAVKLQRGQQLERDKLLRLLVDIQYERNEIDFHRGTFRVRGDVVEIYPAYEDNIALRVSFWGDEIEKLVEIDPIRGKALVETDTYAIFPASHYVTPERELKRAIKDIRAELQHRLPELESMGKLIERQRLEQRTMYDLEMMEQAGFCQGIENYSRHLSGRGPGEPPPTLIDYFPPNYLMIVDESHQSVPQVGAMYRGDRARKENLVNYGFRLMSALDNRPLKFNEWEERVKQAIYVSATPGDYEINLTQGEVIEQLIRPTGLLDPIIHVRPVGTQVDNLLEEVRIRVAKHERVLITTLTKRMAEDLTEYYRELGIRIQYLHSDVETLERIELLKDLRRGTYDVLVGINLLREGLDLPEVSLVGILDADKEGFLRSPRSLIQTIGRAARNANGEVIMYADRITAAMEKAIGETNRRRALQEAYNLKHGITPTTIKKAISSLGPNVGDLDYVAIPILGSGDGSMPETAEELRAQMLMAAEALDFEKATQLRNRLQALTHGVVAPPEKPARKRGSVRPKQI